MAYVRRAVTIELALLMAVMGPQNPEIHLGESVYEHPIHDIGIGKGLTAENGGEVVQQAQESAPQSGGDGAGGREKETTCVEEKVIRAASKEVREFVENVNRISATEVVEHQRLNNAGTVIERKQHRFNYVADIQETRPGILNLDEYRDGERGRNGFPGDLATVGITSLVLIFHPYHVKEFAMACEGPTEWQGHAAWKVHFEQRMDRPASMSSLRVGEVVYPILLQGTAWIDQRNFQIVHLETDILRPVPAVRLKQGHQVLEYGPVQFEEKKLQLWLPREAEIYLDVNGKRFRHRHVYSDYRVFSVDTTQKIGSGK
jgi:hypothetical protein